MDTLPSRRVRLAVYAALTLLIAAAYWQTPFHEFVDYDDTLYVTDSPITQAGLTWQGIRWTITDTSSGNWHPLTRLAHMIDCELFGLNPAGHHVMSVLWHIAATLLLVAVLSNMTGAFWPSAFVAALFGLHPLHVESVAWISERKDVMSAVFWFAAMGAYTRYARSPSVLRYALVALLLAGGLMVKAMLVTLPCVFLLLDVWPLRRFDGTKPIARRVLELAAEKTPLFALVAGHSLITMKTQQIAMTSTDIIPLSDRISNAVLSYTAYVGQMFWPKDLAVVYPYPDLDDMRVQVVVAAAILAAITICAIAMLRRSPFIAIGWLWFLGTLVPVIGIVQVGLQSRADRYTYIPSVGLFICIAWIAAAVVQSNTRFRKAAAAAAIAIVLVCAVLSAMQSRHWNTTYALFSRALAVSEDNIVANVNMGDAHFQSGDHDSAEELYRKAVSVGERRGWTNVIAPAHYGLGLIAETKDELVEAEAHYLDAINGDEFFSEAYNNLAGVYMAMAQVALGRSNITEAETLYAGALKMAQEALDCDPENYAAAVNAAFLTQYFAEQKNSIEGFQTAASLYAVALTAFEDRPELHLNYSLVLERLGRIDDAIRHARRAIELNPNDKRAHAELMRYRNRRPAGSNDEP